MQEMGHARGRSRKSCAPYTFDTTPSSYALRALYVAAAVSLLASRDGSCDVRAGYPAECSGPADAIRLQNGAPLGPTARPGMWVLSVVGFGSVFGRVWVGFRPKLGPGPLPTAPA